MHHLHTLIISGVLYRQPFLLDYLTWEWTPNCRDSLDRAASLLPLIIRSHQAGMMRLGLYGYRINNTTTSKLWFSASCGIDLAMWSTQGLATRGEFSKKTSHLIRIATDLVACRDVLWWHLTDTSAPRERNSNLGDSSLTRRSVVPPWGYDLAPAWTALTAEYYNSH